jgi:hypothetical protein
MEGRLQHENLEVKVNAGLPNVIVKIKIVSDSTGVFTAPLPTTTLTNSAYLSFFFFVMKLRSSKINKKQSALIFLFVVCLIDCRFRISNINSVFVIIIHICFFLGR